MTTARTPRERKPKRPDVEVPALGFAGMLRWAWRQLTKMSTALVLLLLLAIAAVPGSLFPQRVQDPEAVTSYIEANPTIGPVLDTLQLFDVYQSYWFSAIYILLFISLVGCVIPRAIQHFKAWRSKPPRTPRRLSRMPQYRKVMLGGRDGGAGPTPDEAVEQAAAALKKRGYRVQVQDLGSAAPSVAAERGMLKEVGNILFHVALLAVLISVAIGSLYGYKGQKVVVEGESFVNTLVAYDSFEPGNNFDEDSLNPFSLQLDSFEATFSRDTSDPEHYGQPTDFNADLTVTEEPGAAPEDVKLEVNKPLNVDGTKVYLVGNGYAPVLRVKDGEGNVAYEGPVVTVPSDSVYTSSLTLKVPDAAPDQLGFVGLLLPTAVSQDGKIPQSVDPALNNPALLLSSFSGDLGLDSGQPQNVYVLDTQNLEELNSMSSANGPIVLDGQHRTATLPEGKGSVEFVDVKRYVGLDVHYDPGRIPAFISFLVAFTGLIMSLFIARRRAWVRAVETEDAHGVRCTVLEYGLLARGEDHRLGAEAEKLTALWTSLWEDRGVREFHLDSSDKAQNNG